MPMVYATSSMSYAIALLCPNIPNLMKLAAEVGAGDDLAAICHHAQVLEAVTKEVAAACQAAKLAKFEIPTKVILIEELWTPENDMLTAVQKLKRREIVAKYKADIDRVYL
jgi:long-chain acyl-CoA synthetase